MNIARHRGRVAAALGAALVAAAGLLVAGRGSRWISLVVTADQRGDWLMGRGRFEDAAGAYADPMRQGVALYRAARFEDAAGVFARVPGAAGAYDQGNASLMHGSYDNAIAAYDRALELQPGWALAEENRAIAVARRERVRQEGGDATGGQVEPDEIVFDLNKQAGAAEEADGGAPLSDAALSELWLRRVQTTPGDFLRAKFAYQAARDELGGAEP